MATRGRPKGCAKTGGRVKSSIDRQQRQLVSAELAYSILATFEMLGGTAAMVEWAADNKTTFYTQILSRLMPAPQRDDPDVQVNTQVNIGVDSDFEAARRIAFALAKAAYEQEAIPVIEAVRVTSSRAPDPVIEPNAWTPPTVAPEPQSPSELERELGRTRWASELSLTPEQRADAAVVRETVECNISNYRGSSAEQPGGTAPLRPSSQPSAGDRRRAVMRKRDLL